MPVTAQLHDGRTLEFPDGTDPAVVQATVKKVLAAPPAQPQPQPNPDKPTGSTLAEIPRQLGLTARHSLEGVLSLGQILGAPLDVMGLDGAGQNAGELVANWLNLPKPQNKTERVVATATKTLAPAGAFVKAGQAVSKVPGVVGEGGGLLARNPGAQIESAGGAGLLGGHVREEGGGPGAEFTAALAGGLLTPAAGAGLRTAAANTANTVKRAATPANFNIQVDLAIDQVVRHAGTTLEELPNHVRNSIREDVAAAMRKGDNLNADALRRLVDYRLVGATPRNANLTLDPVALTRQKNLAKVGANSEDPAAHLLARAEHENNATLIQRLNETGADAPDPMTAAGTIIGALDRKNTVAKGAIDSLYAKARDTAGRSANLDHVHFTNAASDALDQALLGGKLPGDVRNHLNRIAKGEMPLTVDVAEQLKTNIASLQRASGDVAERMALGKVREALDNTPLLDGQGQGAIDAFTQARRANAGWMSVVDKTPALKAVREGIEPDKFVSKFIVGSGDDASVSSLTALRDAIKFSPDASAAVRGQIAAHLKTKALGVAQDEVGNFSQSGYNKALTQIGERKLALFFSPEEVAKLKAIGRVASYEQFQPRGSAVNNSNSGALTLAGFFDRLGNSPLLSKIPVVGPLTQEPIRNISIGIRAKQATNVPAGLLVNQPRRPLSLGVSPAVGLLAIPRE